MRLPSLANKEICTGCLACLDACNKQAISMHYGDDGHIYVSVDSDKCVGCLRCEKICTDMHSGHYGNNDKTSLPLAAYNKKQEFYDKATSGGVFPTLADAFIKNGGVVYGAAYTDGIHVAHKRICKAEEIQLLQGSKYIQSNLQGIYRQIDNDLKSGIKTLFVGTGCQVASVLSYFSHHRNASLLYTIDLVCGGVPSLLLLESFAKNHDDFSKVGAFRNKERYVFSYVKKDGDVVICHKALPLDGFKSCLTNRYSCYDCEFTGLHRKSDWTIGDYWGDKSGITRSLCLCHTERARQIIADAQDVESETIDWQFAVNNPRLVNGKAPFDNRIERKTMGWAFKHLSYKTLVKIYGSEVKKHDVLWFLYKIYKYIRFKRYFTRSKRIVYNVVKQ